VRGKSDNALVNKTRYVPTKVEPKTFFANERTFVNWLQVCVVLVTLSVGFLNFGGSFGRVAGLTLAPIALGLLVYALVRFHYRAHLISTKKGTAYHDMVGPTVLVLALIAAIIVNFLFAVGVVSLTAAATPPVARGPACVNMQPPLPPFFAPRAVGMTTPTEFVFAGPLELVRWSGGSEPATELMDSTIGSPVAVLASPSGSTSTVYLMVAGPPAQVLEYSLDSELITRRFVIGAFPSDVQGAVTGAAFMPSSADEPKPLLLSVGSTGILVRCVVPLQSASAGTVNVPVERSLDLRSVFGRGVAASLRGLALDPTASRLAFVHAETQRLVVLNMASGAVLRNATLPGMMRDLDACNSD
jgi:uncharacterized membrane protein YidH (DUF202 family)